MNYEKPLVISYRYKNNNIVRAISTTNIKSTFSKKTYLNL